MNKLFFLVCFILRIKCSAIYFPVAQGPFSLATAGTNAFKFDPFVAYNHCGSLAFANKNAISISAQSLYFVEGLNTGCLSAHHKVRSSKIIGFSYFSFGNSNYNENAAKLAFASQLTHKLGLGVSMDYFRSQLPDKNIRNLATIEAGLYSKFSDKLEFALLFVNPLRVYMSKHANEHLPFIIHSSCFIQPDNSYVIGIEWSKTLMADAILKLCFSYHYKDQFTINFGVNASKFNPSLGIVTNNKKFKIMMAMSYHPYLNSGVSSGLSYSIPSKF